MSGSFVSGLRLRVMIPIAQTLNPKVHVLGLSMRDVGPEKTPAIVAGQFIL